MGKFKMRILIDADGCPVTDNTIRIAHRLNIEVVILCDTSHVFNKEGVQTITVSKGADSVDFALVNMVQTGDIVVTQDYGLAAMCLARKAIPINQDGMEYNNDNIDALLSARHIAKKIRSSPRKSGIITRLKGNPKRLLSQDLTFEESLKKLIKG
jgi:uncharacterized protein YaiI (UPF0178 family)